MIAAILATMLTTYADSWAPSAREFRGAWVATVDNIDWPSKRTLNVSEQKRELIQIMDKARELNLNAIIFQVRPAGDALYASKLEPWSEYLTNRQGKAPQPLWDPLAFAVQEAHKRGLQLHAWFNPYRAYHSTAKGPIAAPHIKTSHPEAVKTYGNMLWMDPGRKAVQGHSLAVIDDVVRRYDIDGIHLDDYFYPYPIRDSNKQIVPFPDDTSYGAYKASGGKLAKAAWRRKNTDTFIQQLYRSVKRIKPWVLVGISPFGIYRPGVPAGIKAGIDQYNDLYADVLKWWKNGWCDYLAPQLYWKIDQEAQSYPVLLKWWSDQNAMNRMLVAGNFTSRLDKGVSDWPTKEILDEIQVTRNQESACGNIHFSMKAFLRDYKGVSKALLNGPYRYPAMVPAASWLGSQTPPSPPAIEIDQATGTLKWQAEGRSSAIYGYSEGAWLLLGLSDCGKFKAPPRPLGFEQFAVTNLSRTGIESEPVFTPMVELR